MTDKMGVMYYGNYSVLYEIGRVELMRDIGVHYRKMENEHKISLPVTEMKVKYLRPAQYDEQIKIITCLHEQPSWNISFVHELYNEKDELINSAEVKLVFYDMNNHKITRCPPYLETAIRPYFG